MLKWLFRLNIVPDRIIRTAIRVMLRQRLKHEKSPDAAQQSEKLASLITELRQSPIAVNTHDANRQHYEVPASFRKTIINLLKKMLQKYLFCFIFETWIDDRNVKMLLSLT